MDQPLTGDALIGLFLSRAEAHRQSDEPDLAVEALKSALLIEPDDGRLHLSLSMALAAAGEGEQAAAEAEAAHRLAPELPACSLWLGLLVMERGEHRQAEGHLLEALRLEPDLVLGYHLYALLMYRTGHLAKAEALLRQALTLEPAFAEAHATLSAVLSEQRRRPEAVLAARTSVLLSPGDAHAHVVTGMALLESGHPFRARDHFRQALVGDPEAEGAKALFLYADQACRWVYWPMYQASRWIDRVPGRQFTVWAIALAAYGAASAAGVSSTTLTPFLYAYVAFVLYTWLSGPLASLWLRLRPPVV